MTYRSLKIAVICFERGKAWIELSEIPTINTNIRMTGMYHWRILTTILQVSG